MRAELSVMGVTAMDSSAELLIIVAMPILVAVGLVWHSRRSRSLLERWAERHGYRIIDADYRNFFRGPFFWTSSKGQTIYRVTVDVKGTVRSGWVRCGSRRLGLLSDQVEVRWDGAPAPEVRRDDAPAETTNPMHDRWLDG
jgi:hypothetical protein